MTSFDYNINIETYPMMSVLAMAWATKDQRSFYWAAGNFCNPFKFD